MSNLFFASDPHFGHAKIIEYCSRPFSSVEEMDEALIQNWNATVKPEDEVWLLGDVVFRTKNSAASYLSRLNGNIFYLRGNHDQLITEEVSNTFFKGEWNYFELDVNGQLLVLCHYPMFTWNKAHRGAWQIHGHCHGNIDEINKGTTRLDVGVDCFNYAPVSYEEVASILSQREYDYVDHHGGRFVK